MTRPTPPAWLLAHSTTWCDRTWRDDLRCFIDDIRWNPGLALICVGVGFVAGLAVTVGLAFVWGLFL